MKAIFVVVTTLFIFTGCSQNDPTAPTEASPGSLKGFYVLNEGGFGKSNSSLSLIVPDSNRIYSDLFFSANKRSLGDVANDIVTFQGKGYIVVNNSHKIEVISTETHQSLGTINLPGNSPNKIVIASDTKGYISNLYKGTVTVINPVTYGVVKDGIPVGLNPQGLAYAQGKIFVCNSGYGQDSTLSVIDILTDSVIATINVEKSPTDIAVDGKGNIIVLCNGYSDFSNPLNDTPGAIVVVDPVKYSVIKKIPLSLQTYGHPNELAVSKRGFGLTVVKNGILKFSTEDYQVQSSAFIQKTSYAIAVDDQSEQIFLGDAVDYSSNGKIFRYSYSAVLKDSFTVGIIPGTILRRD